MPLAKSRRAQAAVDFMMSYGIALIMIFIALSVIYKITVLTPALAVTSCSASAGFSCDLFILNKTGTLFLQMSQATGSQLTVRGAACSSTVNGTGNKPAYGNIFVTNAVAYYPPPSNSPGTGITLYSGSGITLNLYCYSGSGRAKGALGNSYVGYIWLNYTIPNYGNLTEQVATLNVRYT